MKIYGVKVFPLGADSPTTFYFKNKDRAQACCDAYQRVDDIAEFNADDNFPLDMLSDEAF